MSEAIAWSFQRDRIAASVRTLRRRHEADSFDCVLADRIAASLDVLDAMLEQSAGDLVADGWEVDAALERVDRHAAALHRRMGGKP